MLEHESTIRKVLKQYEIAGDLCDMTQLVNGHINDTFQVCLDDNGDKRQYILQRINDYVFKIPLWSWITSGRSASTWKTG